MDPCGLKVASNSLQMFNSPLSRERIKDWMKEEHRESSLVQSIIFISFIITSKYRWNTQIGPIFQSPSLHGGRKVSKLDWFNQIKIIRPFMSQESNLLSNSWQESIGDQTVCKLKLCLPVQSNKVPSNWTFFYNFFTFLSCSLSLVRKVKRCVVSDFFSKQELNE